VRHAHSVASIPPGFSEHPLSAPTFLFSILFVEKVKGCSYSSPTYFLHVHKVEVERYFERGVSSPSHGQILKNLSNKKIEYIFSTYVFVNINV
jgi:hypothetical protein